MDLSKKEVDKIGLQAKDIVEKLHKMRSIDSESDQYKSNRFNQAQAAVKLSKYNPSDEDDQNAGKAALNSVRRSISLLDEMAKK
jgi:hypothetical protein